MLITLVKIIKKLGLFFKLEKVLNANQKEGVMKFILNLILLTSLFFSAHLFAEEVTVGKVSKTGKKAVIYIPEGMTVEKGQTLVIGGGKTKAAALLPGGASARAASG